MEATSVEVEAWRRKIIIGEKVWNKETKKYVGIVESIERNCSGNIYVNISDKDPLRNYNSISLDLATSEKQFEKMFLSEDGFDIYENDKCFILSKNNYNYFIAEYTMNTDNYIPIANYYYKEKQNALNKQKEILLKIAKKEYPKGTTVKSLRDNKLFKVYGEYYIHFFEGIEYLSCRSNDNLNCDILYDFKNRKWAEKINLLFKIGDKIKHKNLVKIDPSYNYKIEYVDFENKRYITNKDNYVYIRFEEQNNYELISNIFDFGDTRVQIKEGLLFIENYSFCTIKLFKELFEKIEKKIDLNLISFELNYKKSVKYTNMYFTIGQYEHITFHQLKTIYNSLL